MSEYKIEKRRLSLDEYQLLRGTTNWVVIEDSVVEQALEFDLFSVCIYDKKSPIGMGRVIGDGNIYFYIQDVIVHPEYQGRGIGKIIMEEIEEYLKNTTNDGSFIGLMAAVGVKEFYYQFGYAERPDDRPGMYKMVTK